METGNRSEAIRKSKLVIADLERSFWSAAGTPAVEATFADVVMPKAVTVEAAPIAAMTFSDLFRHFLSDPSKVRAPKTQMIYDGLLWITSSVWGENRLLTSIDRSACRELLEVLRWLPSNPAKRFPGLTAAQAARMAKKQSLQTTLSPGSINGYMAKLRAMLKFAVNEGWIDRNPAQGLNVVDPVRDRDKRLPFSDTQLHRIFHAPLFTGCENDGAGYARRGINTPRRGRFWIPLIALYGGLRLNEICQLDVADIRELEGVLCLHVAPSREPAGGKRLKTAASERLVPIHPMLIQIGIIDYIRARKEAGDIKLFPELRQSAAGYFSDSFSKWFRRFLASAGAEGPRTCFHSLRHCFRDALREGRVDYHVSLALGGWSEAASSGGHAEASYGRGHSVAVLAEAIGRVSYPALSLAHLVECRSMLACGEATMSPSR